MKSHASMEWSKGTPRKASIAHRKTALGSEGKRGDFLCDSAKIQREIAMLKRNLIR